ncbi:hypothetical protein K1719_037208 [Acacia pycnantha]|nr:hypothetical protein K1719_037208 [Acacia pycnantha]
MLWKYLHQGIHLPKSWSLHRKSRKLKSPSRIRFFLRGTCFELPYLILVTSEAYFPRSISTTSLFQLSR